MRVLERCGLVRWMSTIVLGVALGACAGSSAASADPTARPPTRERAALLLSERGAALARSGDSVRAAQYLEAALDLGVASAQVLPLLLSVYVHSGRYRLAVERAERYLRSHPDDDRMRFLTGTLQMALGADAQAAKHFRRVLARTPRHAPAHYALATLLRDRYADPVGADYHFREYLRLDPSGSHAAEARASLLGEVE